MADTHEIAKYARIYIQKYTHTHTKEKKSGGKSQRKTMVGKGGKIEKGGWGQGRKEEKKRNRTKRKGGEKKEKGEKKGKVGGGRKGKKRTRENGGFAGFEERGY